MNATSAAAAAEFGSLKKVIEDYVRVLTLLENKKNPLRCINGSMASHGRGVYTFTIVFFRSLKSYASFVSLLCVCVQKRAHIVDSRLAHRLQHQRALAPLYTLPSRLQLLLLLLNISSSSRPRRKFLAEYCLCTVKKITNIVKSL